MEEEEESESEEEVHPSPFLANSFPIFPQEEFYTEGSLELLQARRRLAEYSLPRLDFTYRLAISVRCLQHPACLSLQSSTTSRPTAYTCQVPPDTHHRSAQENIQPSKGNWWQTVVRPRVLTSPIAVR